MHKMTFPEEDLGLPCFKVSGGDERLTQGRDGMESREVERKAQNLSTHSLNSWLRHWWTSLTEGREDHYDLESEVGDQKLQRVDALVWKGG